MRLARRAFECIIQVRDSPRERERKERAPHTHESLQDSRFADQAWNVPIYPAEGLVAQ